MAFGRGEDRQVRFLRLVEIHGVELVVTDQQVGLEPVRTLRKPFHQVGVRLHHLVELAHFTVLVGHKEDDLVLVCVLGEFVQDLVVQVDRLGLEQVCLQNHHRLGLGRILDPLQVIEDP